MRYIHMISQNHLLTFFVCAFVTTALSTTLFAEATVINTGKAKSFDTTKAVIDTGSKKIGATTGTELVKAMSLGWNLGNTLDATNSKGLSSETSWNQPLTTKAMIDGLHTSGIRTIRIPISWHNHLVDQNYTIDPEWMKRVKQIVN